MMSADPSEGTGVFSSGKHRGGAGMDRDAAVEVHQVEQLQDLFVAGLQAPWPPPVAEMCGDNAMKLK